MSTLKTQFPPRGDDRVIAGVCSGLASYLKIDVVLVRIVFVLLAAVSGAGLVLYVVLWLFMPGGAQRPSRGAAIVREGFDSVKADIEGIVKQLKTPTGKAG
jgi:phage shock protein PspC (stress-responsive transcriptional regulator)